MRFETLYASQYLVSRLQYAHVVQHVRDEGDIIVLTLQNGEQVMIVMVERIMSLNDVQYYVRSNTKNKLHTLMFLWVDMFIATDGTEVLMPDWMEALEQLHGGKLYGYESHGRDAYFFPIYLEGQGQRRTLRYGNVVNYAHISCATVQCRLPHMRGVWRIAGFDNTEYARYRHGSPLAVYFEILGLQDGAAIADVKLSYRSLARQFHPDINADDDAHQQMSHINDAYQRIMQHYTSD